MCSVKSKSIQHRFVWLISSVCFITVLSQMPLVVEYGISSIISQITWILLFANCLMKSSKISLRKISTPIIFTAIVTLFWLIGGLFDASYFSSSIIRQVLLSMFVLIIGSMCGRYLQIIDIDKIFTAYILSSVIVALNVFFRYILGNDLTGLSYLYASKNSVSQILLTGIILIVTRKLGYRKSSVRILYGISVVFMLYILIALKSRATLIMVPTLIVLIIAKLNVKKRLKRNLITLVILCAVILMVNEKAYNLIINNVFFIGRRNSDLNTLTSGRMIQWESFLLDLSEYPLFGKGGRHRESLILTSYLEYGVIFGTIILVIAVYPLYWCKKNIPKNHALHPTFILIAVCYVLNGVFEMLAPFGPGVKCFLLWFLFGILSTTQASTKVNIDYQLNAGGIR